MKKTLFKYLLMGVSVSSAMALQAITIVPVVPVFKKIMAPVPAEGIQEGDRGPFAAGNFYHIKETNAAWGDYNNDGKLDLYYSGRNLHMNWWNCQKVLYENQGTETFLRIGDQPFSGTYDGSPIWFDYNNDGNLDLILNGRGWDENGANDSKCFLYKNNGLNEDGIIIFEEVPSGGGIEGFSVELGSRSHQNISVGDYDKDGYIDVVVTGFDLLGNRNVILYNNNKGTGFIKQKMPLNGTTPFKGLSGGSVSFADMDNDGWLDIVSSGYGNGPELHVYWNKGDGTFTENTTQVLLGAYDSSSACVDYNNDGLMDIVASGWAKNEDGNGDGKSFYTLKNNGDRTFSTIRGSVSGLEGMDGGQISFGDVNHDGLVDILAGGYGIVNGISTWIYLNKGDDTFDKLLNPVTKASRGSQHLIDINNDGRLDTWILGETTSDVCAQGCIAELWKGSADNGIAVNVAPSAPTNLRSNYDKLTGIVTYSWDAATDDVTPGSALQYNIFVKKNGSTERFMTVPADVTTGFIKVGEISGQITKTSYSMKFDKDVNATYSWGIQAIDNGKKGGMFATATYNYVVSGIENTEKTIDANIYANNGIIYYKINGNAKIILADITGKIVFKKSVSSYGTINDKLVKGVYLITIATDKGIKTKSIIL